MTSQIWLLDGTNRATERRKEDKMFIIICKEEKWEATHIRWRIEI